MMHAFRALVCLMLVGAWLRAGEAAPAAIDQWFVGELNGQPAISMHLVSAPVDGGGRSTVAELAVVLRRKLGAKEFRIEIRQRQELAEDARGRITGFRIDHDENGVRTAASGRILDGKAIAEVHRLGRIEAQEIVIPPGTELLGQVAGQERMAAAVAAMTAGSAPPSIAYGAIELVSHRLTLVNSTARYQKADGDGNLMFTVASDILPIPSRAVVTPRGDLVSMGIEFGPFSLVVKRAPGAVALLGGSIDSAGQVAMRGDPPQGREVERYRLPAGAQVPTGDVQSQEGDVVTVRRVAPPEPLPDPAPFLAREPQLETDDADFRAWVGGITAGHADAADRAEALRLAVRSHITIRDLNTADGSALETFRNRKGDCTEHANMLCAALRIAGIPARVDIGIVHSIDYGAWVGHAWVTAWIDGRWTLLDAAYPGVPRSRYLRMGTASGGNVASTQGAIVAAMSALMGRDKAIEGLPPSP